MATLDEAAASLGRAEPMPGGLVRRVGAFGVDYLVIAAWVLLIVVAGLVFRAVAPDVSATVFSNPLLGQVIGFVVLTLPVTLYFALSEASAAGATLGKRRLGLRVQTAEGGRLTIGRSLARSALKFVPWELSHAVIWQFSAAGSDPPAILTIGLAIVWILIGLYLLSALVDPRRRTLYDRLAGTAVVRVT
jgi:uncharacterized RDD family membrane protein YckC